MLKVAWFEGPANRRQGDGVSKDGASNQDCQIGARTWPRKIGYQKFIWELVH